MKKIDVYEQIPVLEGMGFCLSEEYVVGYDGTKYSSYYENSIW